MLTPDQRARIAKWCVGDKRVHVDSEYGTVSVFMGTAKRFSWKTHDIEYRSVYFESLDEIRQAESIALKRGLFADYADALETVVDTNNVPERMTFREYAFLTATAEQRAEAILRVIEQQEGQGDG